MKVLYLDIETSAHVVETWGLYNQTIGLSQLREPTAMICVTGKFHGEKPRFWSLFHNEKDEMLQGIWGMMNDADVTVHYNGNHFDVPHLNREFILGGFGPPSPSKQVDLLAVVRRNFKFASNKLAYVSKALGLEGKVSHEGHALWTKCLEGDKAAWKRMKSYNIQDVILLEELYGKLSPWIWNAPNAQLYGSGADTCPSCGGSDLRREGYAELAKGRYQRFQCRGCNAWSRSSKLVSGVTHQGINPR